MAKPTDTLAKLVSMPPSPEQVMGLERLLEEEQRRVAFIAGVLQASRQALLGKTAIPDQPPVSEGRLSHIPNNEILFRRRHPPNPKEPTGPLNLVEGSNAHVCWEILAKHGGPMTYREFREEYVKTVLGRDLKPHERPYYSVFQRLKSTGHLHVHKGRLCTYENLKKYLADVEAGRTKELPEAPRFHSKWADAVVNYLHDRGGEWVSAREIAEHVTKLPGFDVKHAHTHVCNTLTRVKAAHGLIEQTGYSAESRWRYVGPDAKPTLGNGYMKPKYQPPARPAAGADSGEVLDDVEPTSEARH